MNTGKYVLLNFESTSLDKNLTLTFGSNISINICVTLQLRVLHSLKQNKNSRTNVKKKMSAFFLGLPLHIDVNS